MTIDNPGDELLNLQGVQASTWVWSRLWKKDAQNQIKLNILDSITLNTKGVTNWLFTSSEGTVKRKAKENWNANRILDRVSIINAGGDKSMLKEGRVRAHYKFSHQNEWRHVKSADVSAMLTDAPGEGLIISYSHIKGSVAFVSQSYESAASCGSPFPKFQTYNLCGVRAKGKKGSTHEDFIDSALPTERVLSLNKSFNEACKAFTTEVVKLLESKSKCTIKKISLVLALEDNLDLLDDKPTLTPNLNPTLNENKTGKTVWLHHVNEISVCSGNSYSTDKPSSRESNSDIRSERRSERDGDKKSVTHSVISHASSSFQRGSKCVGDFCTFSEIDILVHGNSNKFDEDEGESILKEIKDARRKFKLKMALKSEYLKSLKDTKNPDAEKEDPNSSPLAIAKKALADDQSAKVEQLDDELSYLGEAQDDVGELHTVKSLARKVPYKSIVLARQESQIIDQNDVWNEACVWGRPMHNWWFRIGRSIHKGRGSVEAPISSGYQIGQSVLSTKNLLLHTISEEEKQLLSSETNEDKVNDNDAVNQVSRQAIPLGKLESNYATSDTGRSDAVSSSSTSSFKASLSKKCVGQLSWYYSDASVCEKCYAIYRNLDRRRKDREKSLMRTITSQQELINMKNKKILDRELDKKIFNQKKLVSRLAKLESNIDNEFDQDSFDFANSLRKQSNSNKNQSNMNNMASIMSSLSFDVGPGGGLMFNNLKPSDNANKAGAFRADVPKFAIPPVPWKLSSDEENRDKYINNTSSSFIKNIKQKAEQLVEKAYTQTNFERYIETSNHASVEDLLFNNHQVPKGFSDHEQNWQNFTGQGQGQGNTNPNPKPKPKREKSKHSFNPDRLLHPWQREMEKMKRERNQEETNAEQNVAPNYISNIQFMDPNSNANKFSNQLPPLHGYMNNAGQFEQINQLNQGSMISQVTWDNSMADDNFDEAMYIQPDKKENINNHNNEDHIIHLHEKFKKFEKLSNSKVTDITHHSNSASASVASQLRSVKFELPHEENTSFSKSSNPQTKIQQNDTKVKLNNHKSRQMDDGDDGDDGENDDDDDEGIGWSPFVIAHPN